MPHEGWVRDIKVDGREAPNPSRDRGSVCFRPRQQNRSRSRLRLA